MPKVDGHTQLRGALLVRGFQPDPRSREALKLPPRSGQPEMRVDFGRKAARLEEKYAGAWRGISETLYYGQITDLLAQSWAVWALARASGFKAGPEPRLERTEAQKKALEKGRAKSAAERKRTHGPGFYVTNATTYSLKRATNQDEPYRTLGEAIEAAWRRYEEYLSSKFTYLLPVEVIGSDSREDAEHGRGYVWWVDGKKKAPPPHPGQMGLPGVRRTRARHAEEEAWPTCLNCGHLTLSDGTCVNRKCLRDRLDEYAKHRRSDPEESGARTRIQERHISAKVRFVRVGTVLPGYFLHGKRSPHAALVETDTGWSVVEHKGGRITKVVLDNASYKAANNVYQTVK
jgi:hypothetical protein